MSERKWTEERIRKRAEEWESMAIGQANMPLADYIEAAMTEVNEEMVAELEAAKKESNYWEQAFYDNVDGG